MIILKREAGIALKKKAKGNTRERRDARRISGFYPNGRNARRSSGNNTNGRDARGVAEITLMEGTRG